VVKWSYFSPRPRFSFAKISPLAPPALPAEGATVCRNSNPGPLNSAVEKFGRLGQLLGTPPPSAMFPLFPNELSALFWPDDVPKSAQPRGRFTTRTMDRRLCLLFHFLPLPFGRHIAWEGRSRFFCFFSAHLSQQQELGTAATSNGVFCMCPGFGQCKYSLTFFEPGTGGRANDSPVFNVLPGGFFRTSLHLSCFFSRIPTTSGRLSVFDGPQLIPICNRPPRAYWSPAVNPLVKHAFFLRPV